MEFDENRNESLEVNNRLDRDRSIAIHRSIGQDKNFFQSFQRCGCCCLKILINLLDHFCCHLEIFFSTHFVAPVSHICFLLKEHNSKHLI